MRLVTTSRFALAYVVIASLAVIDYGLAETADDVLLDGLHVCKRVEEWVFLLSIEYFSPNKFRIFFKFFFFIYHWFTCVCALQTDISSKWWPLKSKPIRNARMFGVGAFRRVAQNTKSNFAPWTKHSSWRKIASFENVVVSHHIYLYPYLLCDISCYLKSILILSVSNFIRACAAQA